MAVQVWIVLCVLLGFFFFIKLFCVDMEDATSFFLRFHLLYLYFRVESLRLVDHGQLVPESQFVLLGRDPEDLLYDGHRGLVLEVELVEVVGPRQVEQVYATDSFSRKLSEGVLPVFAVQFVNVDGVGSVPLI